VKPRELRDAAVAASGNTEVSARIYEKDFYVTAALRAVIAAHGAEMVFKGGTSLSKAYGLIDRFSEDIDLLVVPADRDAQYVEDLFDQMHIAAAAAIPGSTTGVVSKTPGYARNMRVTPQYESAKAAGVDKGSYATRTATDSPHARRRASGIDRSGIRGVRVDGAASCPHVD
jgi:hypothetical protein